MTHDSGDEVLIAAVTPHGPLWSAWGLHLLTGESVDALRALGVRRIEDLPADVLRAGRRRSSESAARTLTRDGLAALRYWAAEMYSVELTVRGNSLWMPRPTVEGRADEG